MSRMLLCLVFVTAVAAHRPVGASAEPNAPVLPARFSDPIPGTPVETPYWKSIGDPVLTSLVEDALGANADIKAAAARIAQAEAVARQARAPLMPSLSAEAGYTLSPYDQVGRGVSIPTGMAVPSDGDDPAVIHNLSATLRASYLIDITGQYRLGRQAALQEAGAVAQDASAQASALISAIVSTYFRVTQANAQVQLVEEQIATSQAFLDLVEAQFDVGAATAVDLLQQRQQLEGAKARLPIVRMIAETGQRQLAVLLGHGDPALLPELPVGLPEVPPPPTGAPLRLLTARADLRRQAARLEALRLREKSAFRALLPALSLSGQVGYIMNYSEEVDHGESWSLGAYLSVPLYQGGANRAAVDQAEAAVLAELYTLQQAAVRAVGEVEAALASVRLQSENLAAIDQQLAASGAAFEEARKRYTVGLSSYLTVLTALAAHQTVQLSRMQARLDLVISKVTLMNALGGDWTKSLVPPALTGR